MCVCYAIKNPSVAEVVQEFRVFPACWHSDIWAFLLLVPDQHPVLSIRRSHSLPALTGFRKLRARRQFASKLFAWLSLAVFCRWNGGASVG
jgi:hypothetical protein